MRRRDHGFTLIEVLVSIAMISVVTASLTTFFLQSRAAVQVHSQMQQAGQMAAAEMERVSLLPGTSLVAGRPAACVTDQWSSAPARVQAYLTNLNQLPDVSLPAQTPTHAVCVSDTQLAKETMPTQQINQITVNGHSMAFTQNIYIGTCGQQVNASGVPSGTCLKTGGLSTLRIVIAVTWASVKCPANLCLYLTDSVVPLAVSDLTFQLPA